MPAAAVGVPAPDDGTAGGVSNGGEWTIYASRMGSIAGDSGSITDVTDSNGVVEITKGRYSAALQFDLSTKDKESQVIKSAKLRLTPMVSKTNLQQTVSVIDSGFTDTAEETPIAQFSIPRVGSDDFNKTAALAEISEVTEYPDALTQWQTDIDITGEVIGADGTLSLHVKYAGGNENKSEYAACNTANNNRLNGGAIPFLYNGGETDYSKWVYPQIVLTYTDEAEYTAAYSDFIEADAALSAAVITETESVSAPEASNGSVITLEAADESGIVTVDNNTAAYNPNYAGSAKEANVRLTVTNGSASYSKVVSIPVDAEPSYVISFGADKDPMGEMSVTVDGRAYTGGTAYAKEGSVVTIDGGANTGYTAGITVKKSDESEIELTDNSFIMPAEAVRVSAEYTKPTFGTSRIAAQNSVSIRDNGNLQSPDLVIGANRVTFVKFDLSGYNADIISEADMNFTLTKNATLNTKAVFNVPNNDWSEENISSSFCIDGTEDTNISSFKYTDAEGGDAAISLLNGEGHAALIIPDTDDASTAANGILKDYYAASTGAQKTNTISMTEAVKAALRNSGDGIVTFMIYSAGGGNDVYSVNGAPGLASRPSLTITESSEFLPDDELITEIKTAEDLETFAEIVNGGNSYAGKTVTLANDIDLSESYGGEAGKSWTPIGADNEGGLKSFAGMFDGQEHTISGLYIDDSDGMVLGLFGDVSGTVKDLTVTGEINGSSVIGGIAASCDGTITNCSSNVTINAQREAGGIVGTLANEGVISQCENTGDITVSNKETYAGGIAGHNIEGTIKDCSNSGKIENGMDGFRNRLGGIVGFLDNGTIENSTNTGEVISNATEASYTGDTTQNYVGGIVGYSSYGSVVSCTNNGRVYNAVPYAGGVAGYLMRGSLQNCSYDEELNSGLEIAGYNEGGTITSGEEPSPTATATADPGPAPTATATADPAPTETMEPSPTATADPTETTEPSPTATADPTETAEPAPTASADPDTTPEPMAAEIVSVTIGDAECTDILPETGELTSVKLMKQENADLTGCAVYAAVYSGGELKGIRLVPVTETGDTELTLDIAPLDISEGDELKVFVWNNNMKPAAEMLRAEKAAI